jgi:hypothetical protein
VLDSESSDALPALWFKPAFFKAALLFPSLQFSRFVRLSRRPFSLARRPREDLFLFSSLSLLATCCCHVRIGCSSSSALLIVLFFAFLLRFFPSFLEEPAMSLFCLLYPNLLTTIVFLAVAATFLRRNSRDGLGLYP